MSLETVFQNCLQEAEKGRRIVQSYYRRPRPGGGGRGHVAVLIFPDDDPRLPAAAARYLNRFLHEFYYDSAIILSSVDLGYDLRSLTAKPVYIYALNQSDMKAVLRFYSFAGGADVRVFSLRMPFNIKAETLIGFKDISADKIIRHGLFGLLGGEDKP